MEKILSEDGSELKKERNWLTIFKNFNVLIIEVLTGIGVALSLVFKFLIYLYVSGRASYFDIPKEFVINNYSITLYSIIIMVVIVAFYFLTIAWIIRTIERQKTKIKKAVCAILGFFVGPLLIIVAVLVYISGGFSVLKSWTTLLPHILVLLTYHIIFLIGFGYCSVYPIIKDLTNDKHKKKKPQKGNWKIIDFKLWGLIIVLIGLIFEGVLCYYAGFKGAGTQRNFQITKLESQTYAVIMTDGEEAVIEKCEDQATELKLNRGEFMKIKCENVLMESKYFEKVLIE